MDMINARCIHVWKFPSESYQFIQLICVHNCNNFNSICWSLWKEEGVVWVISFHEGIMP
jgi:hypothetical protein